MKCFKLFILCLMATVVVSCNNDELNSNSIFDTTSPERNELDKWLLENFTNTYNIDVIYKYTDKETDNIHNVVPASQEHTAALAMMLRHVWIEAYNEVAGENFIKTNTPKVLLFLGSRMYNDNGSETLGVAEGGVKITLSGVNEIDIKNPYIDQDSPFHKRDDSRYDLNYYIFKTMHHEFCHILNQTKEAPREYRDISAANYHASDWVNVTDEKAPKEGFVSGYSSKDYDEDFVEVYAIYVTHTEEAWNKILDTALDTLKNENGGIIYKTDASGNPVYKKDADGNLIPLKDASGNVIYLKDANGNEVYDAAGNKVPLYEQEPATDTKYRDILLQKIELVRNYFANSWGIDIDKLRDAVLRRSKEVLNMDLTQLN